MLLVPPRPPLGGPALSMALLGDSTHILRQPVCVGRLFILLREQAGASMSQRAADTVAHGFNQEEHLQPRVRMSYELRQKAAHRMGLFWKLGSGPLASPQVSLMPCETFQKRHFQEGIFISVINHHSLTIHSVQPEIFLRTAGQSAAISNRPETVLISPWFYCISC